MNNLIDFQEEKNKKQKIGELQRIELTKGQHIPFISMTDKYGCAEFEICSKYKRGKLVELFIYPRQQENADYYYHWEGKANYLTIGGYEGLDPPMMWLSRYCREHKCQMMRIYVPRGSNYLWFDILSSIGIIFTKTSF